MRLCLALFPVLFAASASAASAESWLCIAEHSTGFSFDQASKKWRQTNFYIEDSRYIVRRSTQSDVTWEVQRFGAAENIFMQSWCKEDFNEAGFLDCNGFVGSFRFNRKNNRFMLTFSGSYLTFDPQSEFEMFRKDGGDTPFIEIGTCSQI